MNHEIVPLPGSAIRAVDGTEASLLKVGDYPIVAVCQVCERPIRCERYYLAEWRHLPDESDEI